jgi:hypothetical protein
MLNIRKIQILAMMTMFLPANISWAQSVSGGLRSKSSNSSLNTISDLKTFNPGGVSNLATYGGTYKSGQTANNALLQSRNYSNSGRSLGSPRGMNFGGGLGLSSSSGSQYGSGSSFSSSASYNPGYNRGAGSWNLSNQSNYQPTSPTSITLDMLMGSSPIILLPRTVQEQKQESWQISTEQAIKPFDDKKLQRPSVNAKSSDSATVATEALVPDTEKSIMIDKEDQSRLYTAQQLSLARNFVRQEQYDQALNNYQAARTVDSSNTNALVGIIFCHIMTNKLLAGGLNVLALAKLDPNFWQNKPNYTASLGMSESQVKDAIVHIEPAIREYMDNYKAQDGKEVAGNIRLVHLSKMFLAWLAGDRSGMQTNIEAAVRATPLDAAVQKLCRGISSCESREEIKMAPIKPIE